MTRDAVHPGEHLAEQLNALGMSAAEFARRIEVPTNRVTELLNGKRSVTADTALRFACAFNTSARFWMNLQVLHDLRVAEAATGRGMTRIVPVAKLAPGLRDASNQSTRTRLLWSGGRRYAWDGLAAAGPRIRRLSGAGTGINYATRPRSRAGLAENTPSRTTNAS